jgi:hypothetical protein
MVTLLIGVLILIWIVIFTPLPVPLFLYSLSVLIIPDFVVPIVVVVTIFDNCIVPFTPDFFVPIVVVVVVTIFDNCIVPIAPNFFVPIVFVLVVVIVLSGTITVPITVFIVPITAFSVHITGVIVIPVQWLIAVVVCVETEVSLGVEPSMNQNVVNDARGSVPFDSTLVAATLVVAVNTFQGSFAISSEDTDLRVKVGSFASGGDESLSIAFSHEPDSIGNRCSGTTTAPVQGIGQCVQRTPRKPQSRPRLDGSLTGVIGSVNGSY